MQLGQNRVIKSNCPIGIKIDMYISHEVCKGPVKGIFFIRTERGYFDPRFMKKVKLCN